MIFTNQGNTLMQYTHEHYSILYFAPLLYLDIGQHIGMLNG